MTRTAPRAISLENHRKKVPYEDRTRRSDRAGKTLTALLETRTAKSMRVNVENNFVGAKFCFLQNEWWKWTFWERILLSRRTVRCRTNSVANSLGKHRNKVKTPHKWRSSQPYQKPTTSKKTRKQLFRMNCPIISKQSWGETSFSGKHQRIHRGSKARKQREENKVRYKLKCFLRVSGVSGKSWINQRNHKHTLCTLG